MADMHKTPALALTLRGYIKHAAENWRAHLAAAADQVEENAKLRSEIAALRRVALAAQLLSDYDMPRELREAMAAAGLP